MDQAAQTMIDNLQKNTGKSLEEWVKIVQAQKFSKHGTNTVLFINLFLKLKSCLT